MITMCFTFLTVSTVVVLIIICRGLCGCRGVGGLFDSRWAVPMIPMSLTFPSVIVPVIVTIITPTVTRRWCCRFRDTWWAMPMIAVSLTLLGIVIITAIIVSIIITTTIAWRRRCRLWNTRWTMPMVIMSLTFAITR